jgi:Gnt-I system high-affinity gluconate transporter
VVLVPLIFSLGARTRLPVVYIGIPLLAGLSIAHGFLPPHPSPSALVKLFGADTGLTLIYGLIVGGVTLLIAGPLLALTMKGVVSQAGERASGPALFADSNVPDDKLPGAFNSCFTALLPVIMIAVTTGAAHMPGRSPDLEAAMSFVGQPAVVLLLSLVYATFSLGVMRGMSFKALMQDYAASVKEVAGILLILAGAGALKQVFADGGVSAQLGEWLQSLQLQPLILGWLIAMVIRIALGSATIAGLTAAGIMAPFMATGQVDPNLVVLSIGAGSLMFSHVNDAGFWLFKEYFNLDLKSTFRSWTLMESVAGTVGLVCVLGLNWVLKT